jgi:hypothetical protein
MERIDENWRAIKLSLWSGASGMAIGAYLLVQVFGFLSPSKADRAAAEKSDRAVVAALAPSCADDFRSLPDADKRMATLVANKDSYRAEEAFLADLVTRPGRTYVDYGLVKACQALLLQNQLAEVKNSVG